jgi:arylsulfatase
MAIAWPRRITDAGGIRNQFHHVIDIVPTILDAVGIPAPVVVDGIAQKPIEGVSMTYTWPRENANAPSRRRTQYFEMFGNRAIYHDGWIASTTPPSPPWLPGAKMPQDVMNGYTWELYNLEEDPTQDDDLAARMAEKLRDMQQLFIREATRYDVFPLDNTVAARVVAPRPNPTAGRTLFDYAGELSQVPHGAAPSLIDRSYTITAQVEIPKNGAEGMLVTQGGRFGGYGFYLLKGRPVFLWNVLDLERVRWEGQGALPPGRHTLVFDFKYDGGGVGKGGLGVLTVDGTQVASKRMDRSIPFILQWDETFDVGLDTGTSVDDKDYRVPFRFTGKLARLTIELKLSALSAENQKLLREKGRRNNRASE